MNQEVNKIINPLLDQVKKDKEVLAVALFGSAARNEFFRDIDICIFLKEKKSNLFMTKKRLEFLGNNSKLDVQIFQQLPLYIRIRILKEGKILHCKNEDALYEIAFQTIKEFNLYEKIYEMYLENLKNG